MKNLSVILLVAVILASCAGNKDNYTINGVIAGADSGKVFLQKFDADRWVKIDSVTLEKGEFTFKGPIGLPEMWYLSMQEKQIFVPVFVENAKITVKIYADSADKSVVTGSATHDIYQQYVTMNETINKKMELVYQEWKKAREAGDSTTMKHSDSVMNDLDKEMKTQLTGFVKNNSKSVAAPYLVTRNSWQYELPELEEFIGIFDTTLNSSAYIESIKKRIAILQSVAIGQKAPDFTMNDTTGHPVTLSSLKGTILLVDFWASWCGPCRAENPNVVKAYQDYHAKGFDVLGCSFDQNRDKWIKAIHDDRLGWTHVSDLKGWGNAAGKIYGVNSIPANVLLDKDQTIIARNLRGEDLTAKLAELLGSPAPVKKPAGKKK